LIFDDTIEEKPYTDENEIIAWHFDHCQNRIVKGVNILNCLYVAITTLYRAHWNVEIFHKPIKSNTGLAHSPSRTLRTQNNHCFASIYAFFKLEQLKLKHQHNHFALRSKLYLKALQASFTELQRLSE